MVLRIGRRDLLKLGAAAAFAGSARAASGAPAVPSGSKVRPSVIASSNGAPVRRQGRAALISQY